VTAEPTLLRVALIVEAAVVPGWLAALTARLAATPTVDLEIFTLPHARLRPPEPFVLRLYRAVDAWFFRSRPDALAPVRIGVDEAMPSRFVGRDVVLDFASSDPRALAHGVRYGVWTLVHGAVTESGTQLYRTQIEAHRGDGSALVLYSSFGSIDPASPHRTLSRALWKVQGAFARRLETVRALGDSFMETRPKADPPTGEEDVAHPVRHVVEGAVHTVLGVARRRARRALEREAWVVAARPRRDAPLTGRSNESTVGFTLIDWATPRSAADPFVFDDDGRMYVFFEDEDPVTRHGRIACVRLDAGARPIAEPQTVLVRPYHLSYPFVFRYRGDIFMIPESRANRTVELYRACPFPSAWLLEDILFGDIVALDPTLLLDDGRLWLFVGIAEDGAAPNDELHLYSSESLAGPWWAHPANPVVSDVRSARPGGRIFRHRGHLIRPAQDCSVRYGGALVFNRVDVLTAREYRETTIGRIEPTWLPGLVATHTYNFGTTVEVLDGKRRIPRRPGRDQRLRSR
jgi:hypothetical protein